MKKVFLSHSTWELDWCKSLKSRAEKKLGIEVYLAECDRQPGKELAKKVTDAIDRCDVFLVLITQNSIRSSWVNQEIGYAKRAKKWIIPVIQRGSDKGGLGMLEGLEYIKVDFDHPGQGQDQVLADLDGLAQDKRPAPSAKSALLLMFLILALVLFLPTFIPVTSVR
jgi:hypothetical protein